MRRPLLWGVVCGLGLAVSSIPAFGAEPARRKAAERREAVEKILDQPLEWKLDDREQVTLAELIEHVREKHALSIRWDAATFQMLGQGGAIGLMSSTSRPAVTLPSASYLPGTCPPGSICPAPSNSYYAADVQYFPSQPLTRSAAVYAAPSVEPAGSLLSPVPEPASNVAPSGESLIAAVPPIDAAKPSTTPPAEVKSPAAQEKPQALPAQPIVASPAPLPAAPAAVPVGEPGQAKEPAKTEQAEESIYRHFARIPIPREAVSLEGATVGEALGQMLSAAVPPIGSMGEEVGIPIVTRAMTLDYVIEGGSVMITTQLRANTRKETRVYRISGLKTLSPESLARVITHTVRPWSWRTQATEIAEQLAARWPKGDILKLPMVNLDGVELLSGITLASGQSVSSDGNSVKPADGKVTEEAVAATGQLLAGGAVATVQSIVAALEIVHHGDPPTGVIESLPGILVITQSQGAHREIAALLEELSGSAEPK